MPLKIAGRFLKEPAVPGLTRAKKASLAIQLFRIIAM
jgi:hypothetical protein